MRARLIVLSVALSVAPPGAFLACSPTQGQLTQKPVAGDASAPGGGGPGATSSSAAPSGTSSSTPCTGCAGYASPAVAGTITASMLDEVSGLAASKRNPGVLWTHNDSGDSARFFGLDEKGALLAEVTVSGASAYDWEDIAVGPCGGGAGSSCVWLGDTGDNKRQRNEYVLYRVPEPAVDAKGPFAKLAVAADRFPYVYPDGRHDAEALLVHPTTGAVYVVSKVWLGAGVLYRLPDKRTAGALVTLERVGPIKLHGMGVHPVTGGDVHPCGDRVVLRTYDAVLEYRLPGGAGVDALLLEEPTVLPTPDEKQGEAVAYRGDGLAVFTASEGASVPLYRIGCN